MAHPERITTLSFRLDPWAAEYGSELPLQGGEEQNGEAVDLDVEVPAAAWVPVPPAPEAREPERMVFVDGVRRIEARVLAREADRVIPGAFGCYAVGCVVVAGGRASWGEARAERVLALSGGVSSARPFEVAPGLAYRSVSTADLDPEAPLRRLQEEMRQGETALARSEAGEPGTLVVADGPLRFGDAGGAAVGYVKRLFQRHGAPLAALAALTPGTRTPLLALSGSGFSRYSWFLRLAARGPADFELAGIVRLEVSETVGLHEARRLADGTARRLPGFAPTRGRDPRAPQNLLPIGALESHLRRLMGDPLLARRRIESRLAREETANA